MRFSVIIPLYNKQKHVAQAIQSVLAQSHDDLEVLVVDDGSTDKSAAVAERFAGKKLQVIRKKNGGTASARNLGIKKSKGEYICFLDADDFWKPGFLELIEELIEKFPMAGLYGTAYQFQRKNTFYHPGYYGLPNGKEILIVPDYYKSVLLGEQIITASSVAIPQKVFKEIGLFTEALKNTEDQEMWNRIALKYPVAFHRKVGAVYRQDAPNMKSRYVPKQELPYAASLQHQLDKNAIPQEKVDIVKKIIAASLIGVASLNILAGDKKTARKFLKDPRTQDFSTRKKSWQVALLLPSSLLRIVYRLRNEIQQRR